MTIPSDTVRNAQNVQMCVLIPLNKLAIMTAAMNMVYRLRQHFRVNTQKIMLTDDHS